MGRTASIKENEGMKGKLKRGVTTLIIFPLWGQSSAHKQKDRQTDKAVE